MYNKRRFGESRGDGGYGGGGRSFAPVNVGDEIELKIEAVGEKGDGIAKVKGFVIFVPNAKRTSGMRKTSNKTDAGHAKNIT